MIKIYLVYANIEPNFVTYISQIHKRGRGSKPEFTNSLVNFALYLFWRRPLPGSLEGGGEVEDGGCGVWGCPGGDKTSLDGVNKRMKIGT